MRSVVRLLVSLVTGLVIGLIAFFLIVFGKTPANGIVRLLSGLCCCSILFPSLSIVIFMFISSRSRED